MLKFFLILDIIQTEKTLSITIASLIENEFPKAALIAGKKTYCVKERVLQEQEILL